VGVPLSVLLCLISLTQQPPAREPAVPGTLPAGTGVIRGRVIAGDTQGPIAWALVLVRGVDDEHAAASVHSDSRGRFEVRNLQPGRYRLTVLPPEYSARYLIVTFGATAAFGMGRSIVVTAGEATEPIEVVLPVAATIAGRVVDDAGEPLAEVRVRSFRMDGKGGQPDSKLHETDDLGRFRIFGLAEGEYVIAALPEPRHVRTADSPPGLVSTYYPSTSNDDEAMRVRLKAGQEIDGLEIRLVRTKTFRISGTIVGPDGEPASNVPANLDRMLGSEELKVDGAGHFVAGGLVPGTYSVRVGPSRDGPNLFARASFTIVDADILDVVVVARPGIDIIGRVMFGRDTPPAVSRVNVEVRRVESDSNVTWHPDEFPVQPDGSFLLKGLFGPSMIRADAPPGWNLKAVLLNDEDITDEAVEFRQQDSGHLQVVLTRRSATLEGTVRDQRGQMVEDCSVVLFSANRSDWTPDSTRTKLAGSGADGHFRFQGVRAGRYWIVAVPPERLTSWVYSPTLLESLVKDASDIVIGDEEHRTIDLTLVHASEAGVRHEWQH
jgi:hypothetical protein